MILHHALSSLDIHVLNQLLHVIPDEYLGLAAEQYTPGLFSRLRGVLEKYVREIPYSTRIDAVREINDFFDGFFSSSFTKACRLERVFDNTEMDILILKELQGGSDLSRYNQSQADRASQFGMSTNAMQARIHGLEQGKEILGHYVKIDIEGRNRTAYDNTIHPIFLALNLKEVYFLMVEMRKTFTGTPFEQLALDITSDIYGQLSEYARHTLRAQIEEAGIHYEQSAGDALIDLREEKRDTIFYLKSGIPCILQLCDGKIYSGRIRSGASGLELEESDGNRIPLPDDTSTYILRMDEQPRR